MRLLLSIPGFNLITATAFYAYIGDPRRFTDAKVVASYLGLVARVHQSGMTDHRGHITKEGPPVARWLLIEAAQVVAAKVRRLRAFYQRIKARRGHHKAVLALAAKLARIARTMGRTGGLFASIHPELHAAKLALLDRHGAPCPTAQVLDWLEDRADQLLDSSLCAIK